MVLGSNLPKYIQNGAQGSSLKVFVKKKVQRCGVCASVETKGRTSKWTQKAESEVIDEGFENTVNVTLFA